MAWFLLWQLVICIREDVGFPIIDMEHDIGIQVIKLKGNECGEEILCVMMLINSDSSKEIYLY